ncbi:MAG: hypothetical protein KDD75_02810 [Caldilineaceae bacterium]|nr:hypothetical protein [Caldilineaceae bacterium]
MLHSAQQLAHLRHRVLGIGTTLVFVLLAILLVAMPAIPSLAAAPLPYPTTPPGCQQLVLNGGFENGGLTSWGTQGQVAPDSSVKFSGNFSARIGLTALDPNQNVSSEIRQTIVLPNNSDIALSFKYYPRFDLNIADADVQFVDVRRTDGTRIPIIPAAKQNLLTWQSVDNVSLNTVAGQQIELIFGVNNDGVGSRTWMYVDDVSIIVCPATPTPTWTPTITLTPLPTATTTPVPAGCISDVILNNSFEDDLFWVFGDDPVPAAYSGVEKHTGLRSVRMGIDPALGAYVQNKESFSSIRQPMQISPLATSASLTWWRLDRSEEAPIPDPGPAADRQDVILLNPDFSTAGILSRTRQNSGTWQQQPPVDLTSYRGKSLLLYFNVFNDGNGLRTWQFVDDVTLTVCYPPTPTSTPAPPPTETPTPTITATNTPVPTDTPFMSVIGPGGGEPDVIPAQSDLRPPDTVIIKTSPTEEVLWFGRSPSEVLTWIGIMLGGLAIIGLLAGLIWQYRGSGPSS